jgi:hypothetical protein
MNIKQTRFSGEARCISTALVLGVAMYGAAIGIERSSIGQGLQKVTHTSSSIALGARKTCIMLAWQHQSSGVDRAQCAEYREQWDARRQVLAKNY